MYFQRTGTRFKHLIKQRSGSFSDDGLLSTTTTNTTTTTTKPSLEDPDTISRTTTASPSASRGHRRDSSWASQTPSVVSTSLPSASDDALQPEPDTTAVAAAPVSPAPPPPAPMKFEEQTPAALAPDVDRTGVRTSRSSQSSLCSCDCGDDAAPAVAAGATHAHSLFEEDLRPSSSSSSHIIPPLSPINLFGDAETWKLIFQGESAAVASDARPSTAPAPSSEGRRIAGHSRSSSLAKSDIGIIIEQPSQEATPVMEEKEFVESEPVKIEPLKLVESPAVEEEVTPDLSAQNVERLILETGKAFQAVGTAIADAKALTSDWNVSKESLAVIPEKPRSSSLPKNVGLRPQGSLPPIPTRSPMRLQSPTTTTAAPPMPPMPAPPKSPAPSKSNMSLKSPGHVKRKSEKRRFVSLEKPGKKTSPTSPRPVTKESHPRWTLMEMTANMAEVFSGKLFKQEVEEMLTPARLEQIRKANGRFEYRSSSESEHSDTTADGIPTKDVIDLTPARSSSLLPSPELLPPTAPPAVPPKSREQIQKAKPAELNLELKKLSVVEESGEEETDPNQPLRTPDELMVNGMNFPSPPALSPSKSSPARDSPSRASLLLPAISEGSPLLFTDKENFAAWAKTPESSASSDTDFINLPSTQFSLVAPPYIQGPIRIERSQVSQQRRDSEIEEDDALDWTAFQFAIAGTLDDTDLWATQEDEMDDLCEWWSDFGFEGYGGMVTAPRLRRKVKLAGTGDAKDDAQHSRPRVSKDATTSRKQHHHSRSGSDKKSERSERGKRSSTTTTMTDKKGRPRTREGGKSSSSSTSKFASTHYKSSSSGSSSSDSQKKSAGRSTAPTFKVPQPSSSFDSAQGGQWQFEYQKDRDVLVWQEAKPRTVPSATPTSVPASHSQPRSSSRPITTASRTKSVVSSVPSLPPSPMLDFKLLQLGSDGALDSVPMGFNLGHDLGDFLNWETYHVNNMGEEADETEGEGEGEGVDAVAPLAVTV